MLTRERFAVADLADDGDVGRHAQEPGDEAAQVDLAALGPARPGLHAGDVGHGDVGFEDLLGGDWASPGWVDTPRMGVSPVEEWDGDEETVLGGVQA